MKYILFFAFLFTSTKIFCQPPNDSLQTKSTSKGGKNAKQKNLDSTQLNTLEQIKDAILGIHKDQSQIKDELVKLNHFQDELKYYKEKSGKDSQKLKLTNDTILDFKSKNIRLSEELSKLSIEKNILDKDYKEYKKQRIELGDKQIEFLLNSRFDKEGNPPHSKDFLMSFINNSNSGSPEKIRQLKAYMNICDSIISIKKIFEIEYSSDNIVQGKNWIKQIEFNVKDNLPKDTVLSKELGSLNKLLDDYCQNTNELFSIFKRIYPLAGAETTGVTTVMTPFKKELDKAYFYTYNYKYLKTLLNNFKNKQAYRDEYIKREPFICNK